MGNYFLNHAGETFWLQFKLAHHWRSTYRGWRKSCASGLFCTCCRIRCCRWTVALMIYRAMGSADLAVKRVDLIFIDRCCCINTITGRFRALGASFLCNYTSFSTDHGFFEDLNGITNIYIQIGHLISCN